jgi:hypothetical protein
VLFITSFNIFSPMMIMTAYAMVLGIMSEPMAGIFFAHMFTGRQQAKLAAMAMLICTP